MCTQMQTGVNTRAQCMHMHVLTHCTYAYMHTHVQHGHTDSCTWSRWAHTHMWVHTLTHWHTDSHTLTLGYVHACMCTHMWAHTHAPCTHSRGHTHAQCKYSHASTPQTCTCAHIQTHKHSAHTHTPAHRHACTCTHTHGHRHTVGSAAFHVQISTCTSDKVPLPVQQEDRPSLLSPPTLCGQDHRPRAWM